MGEMNRRTAVLTVLSLAANVSWLRAQAADAPPDVALARLPGGGVQPDVAVDRRGIVHVVYLAGPAAGADIFYITSKDGGRTFSTRVRVNSQPGSAIATGTIRGAQLALGRSGRVHVAWNGSDAAQPRGPMSPSTNKPSAPMLYTHSSAGGGFEPQRNLSVETFDIDGGGSLAADADGRVYVAWHGNHAGDAPGEAARRVWLARSTDDGTTFSAARAISNVASGVCGCCALRLSATPDGALQLLYRSASKKGTSRDVHALVSRDRGDTFADTLLQAWPINACPMTSASIAAGSPAIAAWETDGQVFYSRVDGGSIIAPRPADRTGDTARRKHPRLAIGAGGTRLLVWTEGVSWGRGGTVAWQAFGADDKPTAVTGSAPALPAWSFAAVLSRPGGFTILY